MNTSTLAVDRAAKIITMSRLFNATPERLWRIYTDPAMVAKWWGLRASRTIVDIMDVRVGGRWRYIQKFQNGQEMAFRGEYKVVDPPKLLVATFEFEGMPGHIVTDAHQFEAQSGSKTLLTTTSQFDSVEALEGMLQSGMEGGADETWDRLEELLEAAA